MSSPDDPRRWFPPVLVAIVTAVAVAGTSYLCAYRTYRNFDYFDVAQFYTRRVFIGLQKNIDDYRQATGKLPATLADIESFMARKKPPEDVPYLQDGWNRPLHYHVEGETYDLYSLGRDDQPGGSGLDADLHAGKPDPENEALTLGQFTGAMPGHMAAAFVLAGAVSFSVCLMGGLRYREGKGSLAATLFGTALTAIFAILTAVVISALHLSGH